MISIYCNWLLLLLKHVQGRVQEAGGPLKLWHDVWQILQEIPAGLFNFLWTATKVLSHIIVAGNGLLVVWGEWVYVYICKLSVGSSQAIDYRATRAMTGRALWLIIMMLVSGPRWPACEMSLDVTWLMMVERRDTRGHAVRDLNICHQTRTLTFYSSLSSQGHVKCSWNPCNCN